MRKLIFLGALLAGFAVMAEEAAPPPQPPPGGPGARRDDRSGRMFWRAFSQLDEAERKELTELQSRDQEAFRKKMQQKAEEFRKKEEARELQLRKLIESYRKASDKEKEALKVQLAAFVREDFNRRLEESRRHLESMKQGVKTIEAELVKREKNADAAVNAAVEQMLQTGEPIWLGPRGGGGVPKPMWGGSPTCAVRRVQGREALVRNPKGAQPFGGVRGGASSSPGEAPSSRCGTQFRR